MKLEDLCTCYQNLPCSSSYQDILVLPQGQVYRAMKTLRVLPHTAQNLTEVDHRSKYHRQKPQ